MLYGLIALIVGILIAFRYQIKIVKKIDTDNDQKSFWKQTILFHLIVCLVISGFTTVGHEAVVLLFKHGSFTEEAARFVYIGIRKECSGTDRCQSVSII